MSCNIGAELGGVIYNDISYVVQGKPSNPVHRDTTLSYLPYTGWCNINSFEYDMQLILIQFKKYQYLSMGMCRIGSSRVCVTRNSAYISADR